MPPCSSLAIVSLAQGTRDLEVEVTKLTKAPINSAEFSGGGDCASVADRYIIKVDDLHWNTPTTTPCSHQLDHHPLSVSQCQSSSASLSPVAHNQSLNGFRVSFIYPFLGCLVSNRDTERTGQPKRHPAHAITSIHMQPPPPTKDCPNYLLISASFYCLLPRITRLYILPPISCYATATPAAVHPNRPPPFYPHIHSYIRGICNANVTPLSVLSLGTTHNTTPNCTTPCIIYSNHV